MELTREAIAGVGLTCVQGKYYPVKEVDDLLDDIAESADKLQETLRQASRLRTPEQEELAKLREYARYAREEIRQLRERIDLHDRAVYDSSTVLRLADQQARDTLERARMERAAILADAERRHARIIASNRAAYYSAMQFRQDMRCQYQDFEDQIGQAMRTLLYQANAQGRITAGAEGTPEPQADVQPEPDEKGDGVA